jgi:hypothetical protein
VVFSVVVVVLTGAGTVVSVVVVLFMGSAFFSFTVVQAHSDKRAAARHRMVRCFMEMMVVGVVTWRYEIARSAGQIIWGETRPRQTPRSRIDMKCFDPPVGSPILFTEGRKGNEGRSMESASFLCILSILWPFLG